MEVNQIGIGLFQFKFQLRWKGNIYVFNKIKTANEGWLLLRCSEHRIPFLPSIGPSRKVWRLMRLIRMKWMPFSITSPSFAHSIHASNDIFSLTTNKNMVFVLNVSLISDISNICLMFPDGTKSRLWLAMISNANLSAQKSALLVLEWVFIVRPTE